MSGQLANGPGLNTEIDQTDFSWSGDRHFCALYAITGLCIDPYDFPRNVLGLDGYLQPIMETQMPKGEKTNFGAIEFVRPKFSEWIPRLYPEAFNDPLQGLVLLPARWAWPRIGLLALVAQRCRNAAGEPVAINYVWCPEPFGTAAGHAKDSDHLNATAMDIQFPSAKSWTRILYRVLEPLWTSGLLWMSWGWNSKMSHKFHVGFYDRKTILKGKGRRWDYAKT